MRVLVCGGRDFTDADSACRFLDLLHKERQIGVVIDGDARGADRMGGDWAKLNNVDNLKFPADWEMHGRPAGPIRNQQMLDEGKPDLVVAFPGGKGTADMVGRARKVGLEVIEALASTRSVRVLHSE